MKVLWFTNSPGNSIEYLDDVFVGSSWIPALDRKIQNKTDLHIAFPYPKITKSFKYGETTYHPLGRSNWRIHAILSQFRTRFEGKQELNTFLRIIEEIKPDIIHVHGTENMFGRIIPRTEIPVVVSLQGCLTVIEHKFFGDYSRRSMAYSLIPSSLKLKKALFHKSFIRIRREMKGMVRVEREILRNTKYVIGRTSWDRRILSVLSPKSVYYHCDEIIRDTFYKKKWEFRENSKFTIHSTIKNIPYKGFLTICEALFELNQNIGPAVEWRIVGILPNDEIVKITRRELEDRFPKGLVFLGKLAENELVETLKGSSVFVMPSHIENSSNSLCEAMLLGIPIIATFAGGTPGLINDGLEGILVQDGDPWALAGAILELANNPEMAITFGRNARNQALIRHNPDTITDNLLTIYNDIIIRDLANKSV
jgi:glycosyltransferase involved in cell wall biosynthesis